MVTVMVVAAATVVVAQGAYNSSDSPGEERSGIKSREIM